MQITTQGECKGRHCSFTVLHVASWEIIFTQGELVYTTEVKKDHLTNNKALYCTTKPMALFVLPKHKHSLLKTDLGMETAEQKLTN